MSGCEQDFVHWTFKRVPVSLPDFCFSLADKIPSDFHSQMLCGCLFPALVLWDGESSMELRLHASQGDLCSWGIPPEFQPPPMGAGPALLAFPPFLLVSMWLLL